MRKGLILICLLLFSQAVLAANYEGVKLQSANTDMSDKASLRRGADYYFKYCQNCHSIEYMRYDKIVKDLQFTPEETGTLSARLKSLHQRTTDPIHSMMSQQQVEKLYGVKAPDLSLATKERGTDWTFTYLLSFYQDLSRPIGTNNVLSPGVAMPNILEPFQGTQAAVYTVKKVTLQGQTKEIQEISHLTKASDGSMSDAEFKTMVRDIVNFLNYAAEPIQIQRHQIGVWVIIFLLIFAIIAFFLKKEFWKGLTKRK